MESVTLFADTNAFIQLRDLKDLPWRKLFPSVNHVRIIVTKPVTEELGKHKNSGKSRLRDRARTALNLIDQSSQAPDRTLTLKDTPVRVTLEVPRIKRPDWDTLDDLDPNSPDDRLVALAITYGNEAAVFSHDTGPRITAHDHGLQAFKPLDDWHLKPEQSNDQRKIGELERRLKQALSNKPELSITVEGRDKAGKLTLYRPVLPALDSVAVDRLTQRYLAEYPRASLNSVPEHVAILLSGGRLSNEQVSSYQAAYDRFAEEVRRLFQALHELIPSQLAPPIVEATISNNGMASATDLHVAIHASGDISIVAGRDDIGSLASFPKPPKKPKPRRLGEYSYGPPLSPFIPKEKHPTEVLWIKRPHFGASYGSYGCKDFRPEREYRDEIVLWVTEPLPASGELTITAGANDVPDLTVNVEVTIEERQEEWQSPVVLECVPEFLHAELKALHWSDQTHETMKVIGKGAKVPAKPKKAGKPTALKTKKAEPNDG